MKKQTLVFSLIAAALVLAASCKKSENNTTTLPTLTGLAVSSADPFVQLGSTQEFRADISDLRSSNNTYPDVVGVYWQVNSGDRDTTTLNAAQSNPRFTVTASQPGTYTVTAGVFAVNGGFYTGTTSTSFQAIDPETALTDIPDNAETEVDGVVWMARNLSGTESGRDYRNCEVVSDLFGRYYTWEEAQTACPDGWHLPTGAEFDALARDTAGGLMVNAKFMDKEMWTYWSGVEITNALQFNAIPTGYMDLASVGEVFGYREYAFWWTADESPDGTQGVFRYIFQEYDTLYKGTGSKTALALNVRCVKD